MHLAHHMTLQNSVGDVASEEAAAWLAFASQALHEE
jgi:hypothetical protein